MASPSAASPGFKETAPAQCATDNEKITSTGEDGNHSGSPAEKKEEAERPYSIFTSREKWIIVAMVSFAGVFSPFTANIYFPAIPQISQAFHKSTELINLTVTMYLVMQGLSPMFFGTIADRVGRRPIFCVCLLLLALSCTGLALVPTDAYWLLMVLRCLQAGGSASTIALGAGTIGDIAVPSERGGFFGLYSFGPMVGPPIGPVIGGALADKLGWRAIFWFLCIASGACLIFIILFLPETLRCLVGDGSIVPSTIHRPILPFIGRKKRTSIDDTSSVTLPPRPRRNPLRLFKEPDVLLLLAFTGIVYAVYYAVAASISSLFAEAYPFLNETNLGLCYLAMGGGMISASLTTGFFLDRDFRMYRRKMDGGNSKEKIFERGQVDDDFPIERARLRMMPVYLVIFSACCAGYGWCIQKHVSLAGPLILQIAMGFSIVSVMNTTQTLLVDLLPSQSSSITACNNIVRCSLGAASVSLVDIIVRAIGAGWTFFLFAGICVAVGPLLWVEIHIGPRCRARRRARDTVTRS